jgi:hypothetical protein
MDYKKIVLFIGLWVAIWIPAAGASQSQKEVPGKVSEAKAIATRIDKEFQKARESFLKKDLNASAAAIRRGAAYLASLESQAVENREQAYLGSMEGLERLANRVEKGTVKSVKELDRQFASTFHALAQYHYQRAKESWAMKETAKTGQELKAAGAHLESAVKQAGGKAESSAGPVIQDTRLLADKLLQGVGWVNAEVEKGIKALGVEIDKLGEKVKALKK